ncbi:PASTA domain-containing protein [Propionibacteriaceae bacterium Y1923]|uniref:PASTA domain-containing protein n=1 Tax=Aestuariimicrobium sp. Y1814 TaxID=3418742 RepID=UPI003C18450E
MTEGRWTETVALQTQTGEQARVNAELAGFTFTSTEAYSETVPKGQVISTDPAGGTRALKGSEIRAVISLGPERYAMPSLADMDLAAATEAIVKANLKVGTVTKAYHASAPVDRVLQASQAPGDSLKRDTPINLVISQGPRPIPISNYVGKQSTAATKELTDLGFRVTTSEQHHDSVPKGQVLSQTPDKGYGKAGDTIELVVSKGPVLVTIPKVTGADEQTAKQRLANAGFKVKVVYNTEDWVRLNVVAVQDPGAAKMAPKGSTITIYVS